MLYNYLIDLDTSSYYPEVFQEHLFENKIRTFITTLLHQYDVDASAVTNISEGITYFTIAVLEDSDEKLNIIHMVQQEFNVEQKDMNIRIVKRA